MAEGEMQIDADTDDPHAIVRTDCRDANRNEVPVPATPARLPWGWLCR
jgi:hypothetical protein